MTARAGRRDRRGRRAARRRASSSACSGIPRRMATRVCSGPCWTRWRERPIRGASPAGTVRVVNPATERTVAEVDAPGPGGGRRRRRSAPRRAFPAWRDVTPADRTRLLRRFAEQVEAHAEELALLETRNVGKPIADSRGEVAMVADVLHFYSGAVDKHRGATIPVAGGVDLTWPEPLGVVAAIVPWNFPIAIASWKIGPALACGNTVVVKPAELTPLTALRLAELALDGGHPRRRARGGGGARHHRGHGPGRAPRGGQGRLHGLDRGGARRDGPGRGDHQARHVGARREVRQRRLRRRRPRARRGQRARSPCSATPARIAVPAAASSSSAASSTASSSFWWRPPRPWWWGTPRTPPPRWDPLVSAEHRSRVAGFVDPADPGLRGRDGAGCPTGPDGGSRPPSSPRWTPAGGSGARRSSGRWWR